MMCLEFRQRPIRHENAFADDLDTVHTGPLRTFRPSPKQM